MHDFRLEQGQELIAAISIGGSGGVDLFAVAYWQDTRHGLLRRIGVKVYDGATPYLGEGHEIAVELPLDVWAVLVGEVREELGRMVEGGPEDDG